MVSPSCSKGYFHVSGCVLSINGCKFLALSNYKGGCSDVPFQVMVTWSIPTSASLWRRILLGQDRILVFVDLEHWYNNRAYELRQASNHLEWIGFGYFGESDASENDVD